ncbi:MAG TPA: cytochrome c [Actinomycetota bacterium]|nr:cytochrome c [Actinomycetota bacterium]
MSAGPRPSITEDATVRRSLERWQMAGVIMFVLLVASFPLYKAVEGPRREDALKARQTALVSSGRQLWALNCSSCHGGQGQGFSAPALNSKQFLTSIADDQMHRIVAAGITGTPMPAWWNEFGGPLTDEQIAAIVAYVRSWEPKAPSRPDWRTPHPQPSGG